MLKKIILLLGITLTVLNANKLIKFNNMEITISKKDSFLYFSPKKYIAHGNEFSTCMFSLTKKNKITTLFCLRKNNPKAEVGFISGELKNNKVFLYESLINLKEINISNIE